MIGGWAFFFACFAYLSGPGKVQLCMFRSLSSGVKAWELRDFATTPPSLNNAPTPIKNGIFRVLFGKVNLYLGSSWIILLIS